MTESFARETPRPQTQNRTSNSPEYGKYLLEIIDETLGHIAAWKKRNNIEEEIPVERVLRVMREFRKPVLAQVTNAEFLLSAHEAFAHAAQANVHFDRPDAKSRHSGEVGTAAFLKADKLSS